MSPAEVDDPLAPPAPTGRGAAIRPPPERRAPDAPRDAPSGRPFSPESVDELPVATKSPAGTGSARQTRSSLRFFGERAFTPESVASLPLPANHSTAGSPFGSTARGRAFSNFTEETVEDLPEDAAGQDRTLEDVPEDAGEAYSLAESIAEEVEEDFEEYEETEDSN